MNTQNNTPIRVLIIDDSAVIRQMLTSMLKDVPSIEVVGTAVDPFEAREKIKTLNPDVITLDIEMPKMDGITFLKKIMELRPMPVVMLSTLTQKGADVSLQALELGAVDYISKPTAHRPGEGILSLKDELITKIETASRANVSTSRTAALSALPANVSYAADSKDSERLIAIGSSTGGVEALTAIFKTLPNTLPPIVIAQHMPAQFTESFAKRLNALSAVEVVHGKSGAILKPGHAYIAPGGKHFIVSKKSKTIVCRQHDEEAVTGHKPSVDVMFESVAKNIGVNAMGVILTGMGKDGALGLKAMRDAGAPTYGQNKASCVVYGMPKAAMDAEAVETEVHLNDISRTIIQKLSKR